MSHDDQRRYRLDAGLAGDLDSTRLDRREGHHLGPRPPHLLGRDAPRGLRPRRCFGLPGRGPLRIAARRRRRVAAPLNYPPALEYSRAGFDRPKSDAVCWIISSRGCVAIPCCCRLLLSDRAGVRTQDQRINLPHRLSPTAEPRVKDRVEGLDYLFAVAGVPRIVSEAGPGDPPEALPADGPIPTLFGPSRSPSPAALWCEGLSGRPSK